MKAILLKLIHWGIPVLILVGTAVTFNLGEVMKRPRGPSDDVQGLLEETAAGALAGRWEAARAAWEGLDRAWHRVRGRIILTADIDEILALDESVAELQGAIEARDDGQVRIAVRKIESMWARLGR